MRRHATHRPLLMMAGVLLCLVPSPASSQHRVTGRVVDDATGRPLAGARVTVECAQTASYACRSSGASATLSNAQGVWRVDAAQNAVIVAEHLGYVTSRLVVDGARAAVEIRMVVQPVEMASLVVTASRRLERLKDATIATEVIRSDELRASGASDLASVLTEQTGMQLEGGHPVGAGVMLQGMGSERVLVLVDGQPMIGRMSGQLDVSRIPTSIVDRVEIVKGPQSTLYGTSAMGGVVNVITRGPRRGAISGGASFTAGSRGRLDASGDARGSMESVAWSVNAGRRSVDLLPGNASAASTYTTRYDGMARVEWPASPSTTINSSAVVLTERQRWRTGALYNFADNDELQVRAGARTINGRHVFTPSVYATSFGHLARRSTLPRPASPAGEHETQRLFEAEALYGYKGDGISVDAGIESRLERIDSDRVTAARRTATSVEPFAQATVRFGALQLVPGARLTWTDEWGAHFTPRAAALLHASERLTLRASVGQGYRAPSFKEQYMEFLNSSPGAGYIVRGNASLVPETSNNYSGSIAWSGDRVGITAQAFYNRFDDFIETRELADSSGLRVFTYDNIQDGSTYGTDAELRWSWRGYRAEGGHSYLIARDEASGKELHGRARYSSRVVLNVPLPFALHATTSGVRTGATRVEASDSIVERAAFTRFDVRLTRTLPAGLSISAGIDNITATKPAHWPGYTGRLFHVGLAWQLENVRP